MISGVLFKNIPYVHEITLCKWWSRATVTFVFYNGICCSANLQIILLCICVARC